MKQDTLSITESLLLALGKPLAFKELASLLSINNDELNSLIKQLKEKYNKPDSGIQVAINNKKIQLTTNAGNAKILREYFKEEARGELTSPSLETLTIIAYRQPITKEELEQIRGVNCSLILRNLLIRGLVEFQETKADLAPTYSVTMDFVCHLGINSVEELPDYQKLNSDENLQKLLQDNIESEKL